MTYLIAGIVIGTIGGGVIGYRYTKITMYVKGDDQKAQEFKPKSVR